MPQWLLSVYVVMLSRLQAEQSLREIKNMATARGWKGGRDYQRDLSRLADEGQPKVKATIKDIEAMGIQVERV